MAKKKWRTRWQFSKKIIAPIVAVAVILAMSGLAYATQAISPAPEDVVYGDVAAAPTDVTTDNIIPGGIDTNMAYVEDTDVAQPDNSQGAAVDTPVDVVVTDPDYTLGYINELTYVWGETFDWQGEAPAYETWHNTGGVEFINTGNTILTNFQAWVDGPNADLFEAELHAGYDKYYIYDPQTNQQIPWQIDNENYTGPRDADGWPAELWPEWTGIASWQVYQALPPGVYTATAHFSGDFVEDYYGFQPLGYQATGYQVVEHWEKTVELKLVVTDTNQPISFPEEVIAALSYPEVKMVAGTTFGDYYPSVGYDYGFWSWDVPDDTPVGQAGDISVHYLTYTLYHAYEPPVVALLSTDNGLGTLYTPDLSTSKPVAVEVVEPTYNKITYYPEDISSYSFADATVGYGTDGTTPSIVPGGLVLRNMGTSILAELATWVEGPGAQAFYTDAFIPPDKWILWEDLEDESVAIPWQIDNENYTGSVDENGLPLQLWPEWSAAWNFGVNPNLPAGTYTATVYLTGYFWTNYLENWGEVSTSYEYFEKAVDVSVTIKPSDVEPEMPYFVMEILEFEPRITVASDDVIGNYLPSDSGYTGPGTWAWEVPADTPTGKAGDAYVYNLRYTEIDEQTGKEVSWSGPIAVSVADQPVWSHSFVPEDYVIDLGTVYEGYSIYTQEDADQLLPPGENYAAVTYGYIQNTGNQYIDGVSFDAPNINFEVGQLFDSSGPVSGYVINNYILGPGIDAGSWVGFGVKPRLGLAAGTYQETFPMLIATSRLNTIGCWGWICGTVDQTIETETITITFTVLPAPEAPKPPAEVVEMEQYANNVYAFSNTAIGEYLPTAGTEYGYWSWDTPAGTNVGKAGNVLVQQLTFTATDPAYADYSFTAVINVVDKPDWTVGQNSTSMDFYLESGYTNAEGQLAIVQNLGNVDIDYYLARLDGSDAQYFHTYFDYPMNIDALSESESLTTLTTPRYWLYPGESLAVKITPLPDLAPGEYVTTLHVPLFPVVPSYNNWGAVGLMEYPEVDCVWNITLKVAEPLSVPWEVDFLGSYGSVEIYPGMPLTDVLPPAVAGGSWYWLDVNQLGVEYAGKVGESYQFDLAWYPDDKSMYAAGQYPFTITVVEKPVWDFAFRFADVENKGVDLGSQNVGAEPNSAAVDFVLGNQPLYNVSATIGGQDAAAFQTYFVGNGEGVNGAKVEKLVDWADLRVSSVDGLKAGTYKATIIVTGDFSVHGLDNYDAASLRWEPVTKVFDVTVTVVDPTPTPQPVVTTPTIAQVVAVVATVINVVKSIISAISKLFGRK
ncbi:MAG: hypothetical protein LBR39_05995 [Coriobacteriales bacterium]|jgi:hypothetical protein|nr:hypothetical protein [Coriobacteriales bacterium]